MRLKDKVVVITGSTRGIGRAVAEACAREGAKVVVSSRQAAAVHQTCEALKKQGFKASGIPADVSSGGDIEKLLQHAVDTWGRIDVWINNAGLPGGYRPVDEMSGEEITSIVNVNLLGTLKASRMIIPYFVQHGGGILINMTGKGGKGEASPYTAVYATTKTAITSFTKSVAKENKEHPISIHLVSPGMVATDFYRDIKSSAKVAAGIESLPYVFKAVGVPLDEVGRFFVPIAAQEPGKVTGKFYSPLGGLRMVRAIALLIWYRMTGKIEA